MNRRARPGYTFDPCHCCGQTVERPKTSNCEFCRKELRDLRELKASVADRAGERILLNHPERAYAMPYLPHIRRDRLNECLWELANLVSDPSPDYPKYVDGDPLKSRLWDYGNHSIDWQKPRLFPLIAVKPLRDLAKEIAAGIDRAYALGQERGSSLLMNLASGTITGDQFNNAAARIEPDEDEL